MARPKKSAVMANVPNFQRGFAARGADKRRIALSDNAVRRRCSASRASRNALKSKATGTRQNHTHVFRHRMWRTSVIKQCDNAVARASKKTWPKRRPSTQLRPHRAPNGVLRFFDEKGCVCKGFAIEVKGNWLVLQRDFPHRQRDKRIAACVAVPLSFVIDPLPPPAA